MNCKVLGLGLLLGGLLIATQQIPAVAPPSPPAPDTMPHVDAESDDAPPASPTKEQRQRQVVLIALGIAAFVCAGALVSALLRWRGGRAAKTRSSV
jgi:hypothetical protein